MKENITRHVRPCRGCGEPTPFEDGYCETCVPVEYAGTPKHQDDEQKEQDDD